MIIFMMKLLGSVRKAIAGRKHPHQLAWAVAFGLLLGVVPHGNLLALLVLIVVLTLKVNHAMAGLTAVGVSFAATRLDPYSHQVGDFVLSYPGTQQYAASVWQWPMMPWTDLNNTVVMGSFLIGLVALIPTFIVTYPFFRFFAPGDNLDDAVADAETAASHLRTNAHSVVVVDQGHKQVTRPHRPLPQTTPFATTATESPDFQAVDGREGGQPAANADGSPKERDKVAVETRIDVIRLNDVRAAEQETNTSHSSDGTTKSDDQPMDEALNYLLRQLRDSQARKTA